MLSSLLSLLFSLLPFQINVPSQVGAKEKLREGGASCLLVSKDFTRGGGLCGCADANHRPAPPPVSLGLAFLEEVMGELQVSPPLILSSFVC